MEGFLLSYAQWLSFLCISTPYCQVFKTQSQRRLKVCLVLLLKECLNAPGKQQHLACSVQIPTIRTRCVQPQSVCWHLGVTPAFVTESNQASVITQPAFSSPHPRLYAVMRMLCLENKHTHIHIHAHTHIHTLAFSQLKHKFKPTQNALTLSCRIW